MATTAIIQSAIDITYLSTGSRKMGRASDGRLWCVYTDKANGTRDIKVAYSDNGGTTWTAETVKVGVVSVNDCALAIDSSDTIHVVWSESTGSGGLFTYTYYRSRTSAGVWSSVTTLYDSGNAFAGSSYPDIAVDSSDDVHVTFINYTNPVNTWELRYIKKTSGTWGSSSALVTSAIAGDNIDYPSIAIDTNKYPHIVYLHEVTVLGVTTYYVRYIYQTAGGWQSAEDVNSDDSFYYTPTLILDSSNDIYVVWAGLNGVTNPTKLQITYRKRTSGVWGTETLVTDKDADQGAGVPIGLSITTTGVIHFIWSGLGWGTNTTKYSIQHKSLTGGVLSSQDELVNETLHNYVSALLWANYPASDKLSSGYRFIHFNQTATGWDLKFYASALASGTADPLTRVTALVHRYDRRAGIYQLEVSLGDTTSVLQLPYEAQARRATVAAEVAQEAKQIVEVAKDTGVLKEPVKVAKQLPTQEQWEAVFARIRELLPSGPTARRKRFRRSDEKAK